ncbi:acyltransferase [Escherichia coli]|nr:acyltransferase [Escherichia coli]EJZ1815517.1 acyltransferase [Escherichia coli]
MFFPIILLFLSKYFRKILIPTLGLIAVVSFSLSDKLSVLEPTFNFYSIATRAWELLIGAFAAFLYMRKEQVRVSWWAASMLSIIGVLLIASSYIYLDKTTPFPGRYALMPTVGAFLVILFAHGSCITGRILSIKPVVFIGLISYSAYLWHQPVMAILRHKYVYEPSSLVMITAILGTFALSVFSWKYIETPFRKTKSDTKKILSYSVAFLSLFATIGFAGVHTSILNRFDGNAAYNNAKIRLLGNYGLSKKCEESFTDAPECKTSDNPEIILWGDSYAMHLADMIVASRPDVKLQQVTISQCAPVIGASYATAIHGARKCIENNEKVFEYIKNKKSIKYVVLASPFERFGDNGAILLSNGQVLQHGAKPYYELFKATVIKLKQAGKVPVVIAPPPKYMKNDIGFCLMKSSLTDKDTSKCDFPIDESPIVQSLAIKALKGMSGMSKTIWLSDFICSDGRCHASQGGKFIYRDEGHLSIEGSKYLGAKNDIYHMIVN